MAVSTLDDQANIDFDRLRPSIDAALARYVEFDNDCPSQLTEAIRYALLAPGKRLRPQLVLMAAEACGGCFEAAMPAACAVEMVHAYSLVHDDLPAMDDDDLRRGQPTCHIVFGEALAILVGDALLARAFELLAGEVQPSAVAARCCAVLARAAGACALVGGQVADLESANAFQSPLPVPVRDRERADIIPSGDAAVLGLESIHRRKTGALFVASLELGGLVAGGSDEQRAALASYGRNVGLAFQITDDLLDACGSQSAVGKRVAKDADHGKRTYPVLLGIEESRRRARALLDDACDRIEIFGPSARSLLGLARYVCSRES